MYPGRGQRAAPHHDNSPKMASSFALQPLAGLAWQIRMSCSDGAPAHNSPHLAWARLAKMPGSAAEVLKAFQRRLGISTLTHRLCEFVQRALRPSIDWLTQCIRLQSVCVRPARAPKASWPRALRQRCAMRGSRQMVRALGARRMPNSRIRFGSPSAAPLGRSAELGLVMRPIPMTPARSGGTPCEAPPSRCRSKCFSEACGSQHNLEKRLQP